MTIFEAKKLLRVEVKKAVREIDAGTAEHLSADACAILTRQEVWLKAESILFYAPLEGEVDVRPGMATALAEGKQVFLPRFNRDTGIYMACPVRNLEELTPGAFGILEPPELAAPLPLNQLDFVLAPGVAFDPNGRRLGRGKGYYDRLLAAVSGAKCGVAFEEQIVAEIPVEPHDITVDCILTPRRWLNISPRGL